MKFHNKTVLSLFSAVSLLLASNVVYADNTYPNQPIKLVVPQAPGGGVDMTSRLWASWVAKHLNGNIVVENRPGANGILATTHAKQQKPDGYTVLVAGVSQMTFNPFIYNNLPYESEKDFDGVAMLVNTPFLLVASNKSGIKSFEDLVSKAKQSPNKLNFSSAGQGNSTHLAMEMLMQRTGTKLTHVPYSSSATGLNSIIAGDSDVMVDVLNSALVQVKGGKVVPLAIIGHSKIEEMPEIPTLEELGLDNFPLPGWTTLLVPKGTPENIRLKLNKATQDFFAAPEVKEQFAQVRMEPILSKPEDVMAKVREDSKTWGAVIKQLNISNTHK